MSLCSLPRSLEWALPEPASDQGYAEDHEDTNTELAGKAAVALRCPCPQHGVGVPHFRAYRFHVEDSC
jgi:hypothetical protein